MKMVVAYLPPEAFGPIRTDLLGMGFESLSISNVQHAGREPGVVLRYRGATMTKVSRPQARLECVVDSEDVPTVVETVLKHARPLASKDDKVLVLPIGEAHRISTGESLTQTDEPDRNGKPLLVRSAVAAAV